MNTIIVFVLSLPFLVPFSAFAQDRQRIDEVGVEQKLERLYQLYRSGETVSLKRRESRFSLGVAYALNEEHVLGARANNRSLVLHSSFAHGITDWLETEVNMPLRWDQNSVEAADITLARRESLGLGDIGMRFVTTLPVRKFELSGILALTLPTGSGERGESSMQSSLGVNITTTVRPTFLFGGLAWQHDFKTATNGIIYTGGIGFYLNHAIAVGMGVSGMRVLNPLRAGIRDIATATIQVSYQIAPTLGITPQVNVGLTDNAPDVVIGLNLVWRP